MNRKVVLRPRKCTFQSELSFSGSDMRICEDPTLAVGKDSEALLEELDVLCLETACLGVLTTLWSELAIYAESYRVSMPDLRALVECCFLAELDRNVPFIEFEEEEHLTRAQFLRVLETSRRLEDERTANTQYPYKVPEAKWAEMLEKVRGK